jgi:hypothetical protein
MRLTRQGRIVAVCVLLLLVVACKEDSVKQAAKAMNSAAHALGVLQETVIEANNKGLMSESDTRAVLVASLRMNEAGKRGVAVLRTVNEQIGQSQRQQVIAVIDSVLRELLLLEPTLGIKDDKTRTAVLGSIQLIEASMNSARLLIAASGGGQ